MSLYFSFLGSVSPNIQCLKQAFFLFSHPQRTVLIWTCWSTTRQNKLPLWRACGKSRSRQTTERVCVAPLLKTTITQPERESETWRTSLIVTFWPSSVQLAQICQLLKPTLTNNVHFPSDLRKPLCRKFTTLHIYCQDSTSATIWLVFNLHACFIASNCAEFGVLCSSLI